MDEGFAKALSDAVASTFGWTWVIVVTLTAGFCGGYWIGHGQITSAEATLRAFGLLPFLWLGFPQMFVAYVVAFLAWYLPLQYESGRLQLAAATTNLATWLIVVFSVVERSENMKFFRY